MEQNLRILFEEYAGAYKQVDECVRPKEIGCVMCVEDTERMADIIQEVETLVRKETIEEMLNDPRHSESDEWVVHTKLIEWVKGWALSKGVKLD